MVGLSQGCHQADSQLLSPPWPMTWSSGAAVEGHSLNSHGGAGDFVMVRTREGRKSIQEAYSWLEPLCASALITFSLGTPIAG